MTCFSPTLGGSRVVCHPIFTQLGGICKHLCQNMRANKISASWVSPKLIKSNERIKKERRRRRAKVRVNNGQYIHLNLKLVNTMASFASTEATLTKKVYKKEIWIEKQVHLIFFFNLLVPYIVTVSHNLPLLIIIGTETLWRCRGAW